MRGGGGLWPGAGGQGAAAGGREGGSHLARLRPQVSGGERIPAGGDPAGPGRGRCPPPLCPGGGGREAPARSPGAAPAPSTPHPPPGAGLAGRSQPQPGTAGCAPAPARVKEEEEPPLPGLGEGGSLPPGCLRLLPPPPPPAFAPLTQQPGRSPALPFSRKAPGLTGQPSTDRAAQAAPGGRPPLRGKTCLLPSVPGPLHAGLRQGARSRTLPPRCTGLLPPPARITAPFPLLSYLLKYLRIGSGGQGQLEKPYPGSEELRRAPSRETCELTCQSLPDSVSYSPVLRAAPFAQGGAVWTSREPGLPGTANCPGFGELGLAAAHVLNRSAWAGQGTQRSNPQVTEH